MGIELQSFASTDILARPVRYPIDTRSRRIDAMKASLIEMYGDAAVAIARSQPNECDVGGKTGVRWLDLVEAFDRTKFDRD